MQTMPQGGWVFDLKVNKSVALDPGDGRERTITLREIREPKDAVRGTIREPSIVLDIDGEKVEIKAGLYNLPQSVAGMRVDCAVTRGVAESIAIYKDLYVLSGDARIRCWPAEGFLFGPKPIVYPAQQRWFASMTQLGNEKTYVDAGEMSLHQPGKHVYYHYGTDIGGYDKAVPIVAAAPGRVVRLGKEWAADETEDEYPRDDVVRILDDRNWRYRYSHLDMINPDLQVDGQVEAGDFIGFLGQKGASGGWSHLHFGMKAPQPDGRCGQVNAYPFFAEAYLSENPGSLLACARPHRVAAVGQTVRLDASNSICDGAAIKSYEWTLQDGTTRQGPVVGTTYECEGMYSEMVTITDDQGRTDIDFCVVQIISIDADPAHTPPAMHVTYFPTTDLRPGQPIAFKARAFIRGAFAENKAGIERWDFGDGTTAVSCSDDCFDERWHAYAKPGRYIVTIQRTGKNGLTATAQLKVIVE